MHMHTYTHAFPIGSVSLENTNTDVDTHDPVKFTNIPL